MRKHLYVFILSIFLLPTVSAESFVIDAYDVQIKVATDGYFDVVETIDVRFSEQRRGIFRTLPRTARVDGKKFRMRYSNVTVENWKYTTYDESGNFVVRIGDADIYINGQQQYVIRYRVTGAFLWLDDHTEFYWNIIGTQWPVPISNVTYRIEFPADAYFTADDYGIATGTKGSQKLDATIERDRQVLIGQSTGTLSPFEGLSVAVRLPSNAILKPAGYRDPYNVRKDYTALIPAGLLALIIGFWRNRGKNYRFNNDNVPDEYYPPDGLSAAEVGTLFDHKANTRDVISLIPRWGNQGIVRVSAVDERAKDMLLIKQGELPGDAPVYERVFFDKIFEDGDEIWVKDLNERFYSTMSKVKKSLGNQVRTDRVYDKEAQRIFNGGWFLGLFFIGLIGGIVVMATTGYILTGFLCIVVGIAGLVIHFMPTKRSEEGTDLQRRLTGLRNFLRDTPEAKVDELIKEDPDYFSRMLPYAVAFGLDAAWIAFFTNRQAEAPGWWYYGNPGMHHHTSPMSSFSSNFNLKTVSSAFTSSPAPAGGSGSGGGFSGSSGGGFGGGGGGSW